MEQTVALNIGTFFTVIFGVIQLVVVTLLAWVMKDLRELSKEHGKLKDEVQNDYARKVDLEKIERGISVDIREIKEAVKDNMAEMKAIFKDALERIHARIDQKADK